MVLATIKPRVATLQIGDEKFPKPKKAMGFGERKAHYLSKRPDPRFATWIGRNSTKTPSTPVVPANCVPRDVGVTDHSAVPAETPKPDAQTPNERTTKGPSTEGRKTEGKGDPAAQSEKVVRKKAQQATSKAPKHGNRAENPIGKSGRPFWVEE